MGRQATCGGDAVKAHESIEAGCCPGQDARELKGHESPNTKHPLFGVTRKKSHNQKLEHVLGSPI
jgi:hypothetical protein